MNFQKYEVGKVIDQYVGVPEGIRFDLSDSGALFVVLFRNPTQNEIDQFKAGTRFEMRFVKIYNVIMTLFKIGTLKWMDTPYSPHLSKGLTHFEKPEGNQGLALTIMLVDCISGELKHLRLIGLPNKFSIRLLNEVVVELQNPFDKQVYDQNMSAVMNRYQTSEIVKMARDYYKE